VTIELRLLSRVSYRGQEISGPRLRGLLAMLAADLRAGCGTGRLVDGLWPEQQPEHPAKAVQILVSRARTQLGQDVIVRTATGYRLALSEEQVDAAAVLLAATASARAARAGDHAAALAHAESGLRLWDGPPDPAGYEDPVSTLRAERAGTYRSLVRARALALSRVGRPAEATGPLTELARERPHDEEVLLELLRSEAATVGPSAALARYEAYRGSLRDELGTDPGPALQGLHQQLLRGERPAVRQGVPHDPNPLLGRDDDLAAVAKLLRASRVTSIVGPGGLGKTRLAYAVARLAEQPAVRLVGLAGVTGDADVASEVASALGVGEPRPGMPRVDPVAGIASALGPGPALLVLDNCEHVIGGAAELVGALVSLTEELRVLTTSRSPLGLSSESVFPLPELSLTTSIQLFGQRARAARPGVALPADAVAEVCRHLDGLPLAVELAAARVRTMSVLEIARGLDDRFGLLRGGPRDAPERHQTLQAVVDWSWNLLDPAGQTAMRALSIFPGGFTADAARRVLGAGDVHELLEDLSNQSLLKVIDTAAGVRFQMLETVREFSAARREAAGETEQHVDGLLGWACEVGAAHHDGLYGPDPFRTVDLIRSEHDNLVLAHRLALARDDLAAVAATTALLGQLWTVESQYGRLAKLVQDSEWPLSHYRPDPEFVEVTRTALALLTMFTFSIEGPRASRAQVALHRLPPAPPDTLPRVAAVVVEAARTGRSALVPLSESEHPVLAATANAVLSYLWEAEEELGEALAAARRMLIGPPGGYIYAAAQCRVAELCLRLEDGGEARRLLTLALPVLERLGSWSDVDGLRWWLVLANLQVGAVDDAEHWLERVAPQPGDERRGTFGFDLGVRAEVLLARGEVEAGLRLWRRLVDRLRAAGDRTYPEVPADRDPWPVEARAVTVVAHAEHGRLELVEEVVREVRQRLETMLRHPIENPPPYYMESALCGILLLALAMVEVGRGEAGRGARMVALAERFGYLKNFQPTMSSARVRAAAEQADRPAYRDAVSRYAGLSRAELRAAALTESGLAGTPAAPTGT
jgi:predicted ATPase/DNA-binding SARP family transcriptional activator/tetratricopeptide (TPR) repeat protein